MTARRAHRNPIVAGVLALAMGGCAHTPAPGPAAPPARFADSTAFAEIRHQAFALLERDLDGDGLAEALVIRQVADGWAAVFFRHRRDEQGESWSAVCQAESLPGPELDQVRWVELTDGPLLLISSIDENPDDVVQHIMLLDPGDGCSLRLRERLLLVRPEAAAVISPGVVPAGLSGDPGGLQLIDQPQLIHLEGAEGPVELLTGVRRRVVAGSRQVVEVNEQRVGFLTPRRLVMRPLGPDTDGPDLGLATDGDDATSADWPTTATASISIEAEAPIRLLELHWGCATGESGAAVTVSLTLGQEPPYLIGTPVPARGAVLAVGRQHEVGERLAKALVAVRSDLNAATIELGPPDLERCLREVKGYGFH